MPHHGKGRISGAALRRKEKDAFYNSLPIDEKIVLDTPVEVYYRNVGKIELFTIHNASIKCGVSKARIERELLEAYRNGKTGFIETEHFVIRLQRSMVDDAKDT